MAEAESNIEFRRTIKASREVAFRAWTSAEHVKEWWRPTETARCTKCEIDLRVGGKLLLHMTDLADGSGCEIEGEFREIAKPERLVYSWSGRTDQGVVADSVVTVEFVAKEDDETELILRHSGLSDPSTREGHREGWEKMLKSYSVHASSPRWQSKP